MTSKLATTSTTILVDIKKPPKINILLPVPALVSFLMENFVCRQCGVQNSESELELELLGIAGAINFRCWCGKALSVRADLLLASKHKVRKVKRGKPYANKVNSNDYELNNRLTLGLQLCGAGRKEVSILSGMLNLHCNPMKNNITPMNNFLGHHILTIGREVLKENLKKEMAMSTDVVVAGTNRKLLSVAGDCRWDKRGSGRRRDSQSGTAVSNGNKTQLTIEIEQMSQYCVKCQKQIPHDPAICSKNYTGSAKGMEARGALAMTN